MPHTYYMTTYAFDVHTVPTDDEGYFLPMPTARCVNADDPQAECSGETEVRYSRSGMTATLRCDACQMRHDDILDGIARRYPDSDVAPSWFDPTYAGERWDSDY